MLSNRPTLKLYIYMTSNYQKKKTCCSEPSYKEVPLYLFSSIQNLQIQDEVVLFNQITIINLHIWTDRPEQTV